MSGEFPLLRFKVATCIAMAVALLGVTFVVGRAVGASAGTHAHSYSQGVEEVPTPLVQKPTAVDIGFAQDMIVHHQQAVTMAEIAALRGNPRVRAIADVIRANQLVELGQMQGALSAWGQPWLGQGGSMQWMHAASASRHEEHDASSPAERSDGDGLLMPGMATQEELNELARLTGKRFEVRFLQLMLRHHAGALPMAAAAVDATQQDVTLELASRIAFTQSEEISRLSIFLDRVAPLR